MVSNLVERIVVKGDDTARQFVTPAARSQLLACSQPLSTSLSSAKLAKMSM